MLYPNHYGSDPLFPQASDFEIVMKDDKSGRGVICYKSFKKGEIIAKMSGEIVQDLRQHTLQIDSENHLYDIYFAGYFLHSCGPNISLDMKNMTVTALKDIKPNTYLYMDYRQTERILYKHFQCSCGSRRCRGWIVGNEESTDSNPSNKGQA